MNIEVGTTYTSGSLLHQRLILAVDGDDLSYEVVNSHAAVVIGSVHECTIIKFQRWAKRCVSASLTEVE